MPTLAQSLPGRQFSTAVPGFWSISYLGGENLRRPDGTYSPDTNHNWQSRLPSAVYDKQVYSVLVANATNWVREWSGGQNISWISTSPTADDKNGYYAFKLTMNDASVVDGLKQGLTSQQVLTLDSIEIRYTGDDHLHAIIVNDTLFDLPTNEQHYGWKQGLATFSLNASDINWNMNGSNEVVFIVHNNGWTQSYDNAINPLGFAGDVQARYQISAIPEPETFAMLLVGLGIIGAVARSRRRQR